MKKLPDYRGWDLLKKPAVEQPTNTMERHTANLTDLLDKVADKVAAENVALVMPDQEGPVAFGGRQTGQAKPGGLVILIGISPSQIVMR
ncbi:hypothetical protein ACFLWS_00700 [Chloroflexota bacterium]